MEKGFVVVMVMILGFISVVTAVSGTARYYDPPYTPSACYGFEDQGVLIAGATDVIYDNGAGCGTYYSVNCTGPADQFLHPCTGKSVIVKIVDHCPAPGCDETLNLSQDAFSIIANLTASKIKIDYELVEMIKME
ncbi:EG45-like domain containing protein [Magnolia sinica]|uniref:EG45-like domain containing protein n=1 Tax=Magnolia sinica TaxID=86752 RepID=UPI00265B553B|nr:EG45-like domain containing protein [Magnolia sinica]